MTPNILRLLLTLLSLLLAYGAQLLLEGKLPAAWLSQWTLPQQSSLAYAFYGLAMVIFGLSALPPVVGAVSRLAAPAPSKPDRGEPDARIVRPSYAQRSGGRLDMAWRWEPLARAVLVVAAVDMSIAASAVLWLRGESGAVRWLWLGSLVSLVASQIPLRLPGRKRGAPALSLRSGHARTPHLGRGWTVEAFLVLLVVGAAFFLRFYLVETIPDDLHGDMASHGLEARKLLAGEQPNLFSTMWAENPAVAFMPAALCMKMFGNNLFGLNMASVIGGTLCVLALYLLTRELFEGRSGRRTALLAAAILAISYVHNHFSRIAEYMDPWPFALFSLYLLVRGLKKASPNEVRGRQHLAAIPHGVRDGPLRSGLVFVSGGLLLAGCLQMYYSGRVVPVVIGAFIIWAFLLRRDLLRGNWGGLVLFALAALLGLGPMIPYYLRNPFNFLNRSREVLLFNPPVMVHLMGKYQVNTVSDVVKEQFKRSLLMFHTSIDSSTQFGLAKPLLDPYTSPLLVLGLGVALRRLRRPGHALTVIWMALIMMIGSALTDNAPFWPRLVGILPPACLLVALALERTWALLEESWGETAGALVALLLCVGIVYVGLHNWQLYHSAVEDNARPRARIGRYLYGLDADVNGCMITDPFELSVREIAFLAYPRATYDLPPETRGDALGACPGPRRVFILTPNHLDVLPELQARYPAGIMQEHHETNGTLVFVSYLLDG